VLKNLSQTAKRVSRSGIEASSGGHGRRYELKRTRSQGAEILSIGRLAERAGLRPSAIRFDGSRGLPPAAERVAGRRVYAPAALDRLAAIALAKRAGFMLAETLRLLAGGRARGLARKQRALDAYMAELPAQRRALERLAACGCTTLLQCGRIVSAAQSRS
jgi:MerR family redox-sensitive transcriptional activator SoxR